MTKLDAMKGWTSFLRVIALLVAAAGLTANGAQAHVQLRSPDSIDVPMCGDGHGGMVHIGIGDPVPSDTSMETCCGACVSVAFALAPTPVLPTWMAEAVVARLLTPASLVDPSSPLWPGAPPLGPPASLKA